MHFDKYVYISYVSYMVYIYIFSFGLFYRPVNNKSVY